MSCRVGDHRGPPVIGKGDAPPGAVATAPADEPSGERSAAELARKGRPHAWAAVGRACQDLAPVGAEQGRGDARALRLVQERQLLAGGGVPDRRRRTAAGRHDLLAAGTEARGLQVRAPARAEHDELPARVDVPDPSRPVDAGRHHASCVAAELGVGQGLPVGLGQRLRLRAGGQSEMRAVPSLDAVSNS